MFTIAWLIYLMLRKEPNNVTQDEKCKYMYRSLVELRSSAKADELFKKQLQDRDNSI